MPNDKAHDPTEALHEADLLARTDEEIADAWLDMLIKILERAEARRLRLERKFAMKEQENANMVHRRD